MKGNARICFDVDTLRDLAGEKVFKRGEEYFRQGAVELLEIKHRTVLARVDGTEQYRVELVGSGTEIDGECSCRAFEDWGFCKHMVATALAANAARSDTTTNSAFDTIRNHLKTRGFDELIDIILESSARDAKLLGKLQLAATASTDDGATLETNLRKAIDTSTRIRDYVDYRQARAWSTGVNEALDAVAELAGGPRAGIALKLAEHALDRIGRASESIDDSDGHCGSLLARARKIHFAAVQAVRPEPVRLARYLFDREVNDEHETFHGAAEIYVDVLGEAGLAEYRKLAVGAWEGLPRAAEDSEDDEDTSSYDRLRLESILDFFAERDGDVEARIALRASDLSSPWSYLQLAEFCLSQGRTEEALRRAEEGLWMFEDGRPDERLVLFTANLMVKANRRSDAEQLLWRSFEKAPSVELYGQLRMLGGTDACERALKLLEGHQLNHPGHGWHSPSELMVRILMREKMMDAAWVAMRRYGGSFGLKEELAKASEKTHAHEALEVYGEGVERFAKNAAYAEAVKLIARMARLRAPSEQAAYLSALKERHGRKRSFMKLLG